jgi:hypothetical protein
MKLKSIIDKMLAWLSGAKRKPVPEPPTPAIEPFDGRTPILDFGEGQEWTLRDAYEGVQIFGGTGSGKTSGSGAALALSFLNQGFGGLVLTAKPDERALWEDYCAAAGRELAVFGPNSHHRFNFLEYEFSRGGLGAGLTRNVAELFVSIADINQGKSGGGMETYWKNGLNQLLCRTIDLTTTATGELTLPVLLDVIMSAPQSISEANSEAWKSDSFCAQCLQEAEAKRTEANAPDLDHTKRFWLREFPALGDRTRSSIISMFTVIADGFLTGPIRELYCTDLTIVPEETHQGKIILIDLPIEVYNEVGVVAQLLWKLSWQRATARREPQKDGGIPTFLWADEAQFFASSNDLKFQATARSKRACTVYLTQNLPTYYERGGKDRTHALLGNLQTRIFHSQGDHVTNSYAADTIARGVTSRSSTNVSTGNGGMSFGTSEAVDYVVPPAEFQRLRRGGLENGNLVDAYIFQAGRIWRSTGESFLKAAFKQPERTS